VRKGGERKGHGLEGEEREKRGWLVWERTRAERT